GEFVRTPKFSLARTADDWIGKAYRGGDNWICGIELAIGLYFSVTVVVAIQLGMWPALPFLMLYQAGYLYIGLLSLIQRRRETSATVLASS
ncbi:uncharacterized protein METZ01_LOCUS70511, partial [marine metagenome]